MIGRFKIIVPSFNSVRYLPKTLSSIAMQTETNYDVCVIDDCSTLKQQRVIIQEFCQPHHWKFIFHEKNLGALTGIIESMRLLECQPEDVVMILDGDDWFYNAHVLTKLKEVYTSGNVWLTWGQFVTHPPGCIHINYADRISREVIEKKLYRRITDIFGPLRTFKHHLFARIKDEDLRDPQTGEYFRVSWDKAFMYPMLEMAGEKGKFIEDILYVYNIDNPLNDFKINREDQEAATRYIRNKQTYRLIE